jgi:putative transposase
MQKGFCYLVAIMDLYSRKILSWRLSNTLDKRFCIEALNEALERYPKPDIFNSDQAAQFTSHEFTSILKQHDIQISMDGKGSWIDNVFITPLRQRSAREDPIHSGLERAVAMIERFWRSLKYEEVYLRAYQSIPEAKTYISTYIQDYNQHRRHSSLDKQTPDFVYNQSMNKPILTELIQTSTSFTPRPCS